MGLSKPKIVPKPEPLKSLEQCEALGALPVLGGVNDQSYIWLQAVAICRRVRQTFEISWQRSRETQQELEKAHKQFAQGS